MAYLYFRVLHMCKQLFLEVLDLLPQIMIEQTTDQLVLCDVEAAIDGGQRPLDPHVGHRVTPVPLQVTLYLQVQQAFLLQQRTPLQSALEMEIFFINYLHVFCYSQKIIY